MNSRLETGLPTWTVVIAAVAEMIINGDTRLNKVLDAAPAALDYIVSLNPHDFERLRNPFMRKYMSPRIMLRRVAAMAGIEESGMLRSLVDLSGGALSLEATRMEKPGDGGKETGSRPDVSQSSKPLQSPQTPPIWVSGLHMERLHWVDLLPIDDVLGDPMLPVTIAVRGMQPSETIGIRHRWEPQPLYDIWQKMGLEWYSQPGPASSTGESEEWHIFVHKPMSSRPPVPTRTIQAELRHLPEAEVGPRVVAIFEQLEVGQSLEVRYDPAEAQRVIDALEEKHSGEYSWGKSEEGPDNEIITVKRLALPYDIPGSSGSPCL